MEKTMSQLSKISVALAATSVIVLSASAAHATVNIPRPVINIPRPVVNVPRPVISVAVPKPAVNYVSTPISSLAKPSMFAGKPATVQNTVSNWRSPTGAGTQNTSMIYQNGKLVAATSAIAKFPATTAPKPGVPVTNNNGPIKPGTVQIANHPAPSMPAPAANQPAPAKPAAAPPPAKPKITFTPVEYPAFTVNGAIKGYYVNGKLVMGLTGPSGSSCGIGTGFQIPGSSGVSANYSSGAISIPVVKCMLRS
jgi:hypothetical protein